MISIIHGAKGTGKTKTIIDRANMAVHDGEVVFITDSHEYNYSIKHKVRLVNAREYDIASELGLLGFIRGLVASNHDVQHIFIDSVHRLCGKEVADMSVFYENLGAMADKINVDITLAVGLDESELPEFVKKYI